MEDIKDRIQAFMEEAGRPISFKDLTQAFGVERHERDEFKKCIKGMAAEGLLIKTRDGRYGLPLKMNLVTGTLSCHADGFGFVCPGGGETDVFVNPRRMSGAMHGDTVMARVEGQRGGGKREGSIIRVLNRAHKLVVGRFETAKGFSVVIPSDEKILERIIIPGKEKNGAVHGMIVVAEIEKWPTKNSGPSGRIVEVIGDPQDADVEAEVILRKFGLPGRFPREVVAEAKNIPSEVSAHDISGRVDLRGFTTITIDGESARDFDDAVSLERTGQGYRLRVSIADVSHYVRPSTVLDREAYERSTSVYFPDRCVPMLPEALSNGICSLNPRVDRLTMTAELEFDGSGTVVKKRLYESVIKSAERMTYTNVKKLLREEDSELSIRYQHIINDLRLMEELALKLMARRRDAGSIDFDLPEPEIIIGIEGTVEDIVRAERHIAHKMIEEFMLAANRAVAEEFSSRSLPFLYRVHASPSQESIDEFKEFVAAFGIHLDMDKGPKAMQAVLKSVEGRPEERLINHVLLRSMKQAVYSPDNVGHFGLAFKDYGHFTSPIRRYPDLVVHRLVRLLINGKYTQAEAQRMEALLPETATHTSGRERKAMEAEREIADLKKCQFMKDKTGQTYDGFISGVTGFGLFVELKEYFVEGLVHVSMLSNDYYIFDDKRHTLRGERTGAAFKVGDPVTVRIARVDIERRRIDLVMEEDALTAAKGAGAVKTNGKAAAVRPGKSRVQKTDASKGKSTGRRKKGR